MSDDMEWFVQKPRTYSAVPISWQGWLVTLLSVVLVLAAAYFLIEKPVALAVAISMNTLVLLFVLAKTTRGGWQWRWEKTK